VGLEVEALVAALELVELHDPHPVAGGLAHDVEEARLGHHQPVAGVAHDEGDLLGRRRVVEAERRRAEQHRRRVDDVELGAVEHHQPERVAAAQAEVVEAPRRRREPAQELREGQRERVVGAAQRDLVGLLSGGRHERLAHRRGAQRRRRRGNRLAEGHSCDPRSAGARGQPRRACGAARA
jgi:hypothetical protein